MEAAASRGFHGVPLAVMDRCLQDINCPKSKRAHERAAMLIKAWRETWGWNDVDVARALQGLLPGSKTKPKKTPRAAEDLQELVWSDITSVIAALNDTEIEVKQPVSAQEAEHHAERSLMEALSYNQRSRRPPTGGVTAQKRRRTTSRGSAAMAAGASVATAAASAATAATDAAADARGVAADSAGTRGIGHVAADASAATAASSASAAATTAIGAPAVAAATDAPAAADAPAVDAQAVAAAADASADAGTKSIGRVTADAPVVDAAATAVIATGAVSSAAGSGTSGVIQSRQAKQRKKRKLGQVDATTIEAESGGALPVPSGPPHAHEPLSKWDNPCGLILAIWKPLPRFIALVLAQVAAAASRAPAAGAEAAPAAVAAALPAYAEGVHPKKTGVANVEFAKSSTSVCRLCNNRIPKGSVRFLYWWARNRPAGYIHTSCLHLAPESSESLIANLQKVKPDVAELQVAVQEGIHAVEHR